MGAAKSVSNPVDTAGSKGAEAEQLFNQDLLKAVKTTADNAKSEKPAEKAHIPANPKSLDDVMTPNADGSRLKI